MEMTCLVKRQLPVVPVDVPIFNKHDRHIRHNPGDMTGQQLWLFYCIALFKLYTLVIVKWVYVFPHCEAFWTLHKQTILAISCYRIILCLYELMKSWISRKKKWKTTPGERNHAEKMGIFDGLLPRKLIKLNDMWDHNCHPTASWCWYEKARCASLCRAGSEFKNKKHHYYVLLTIIKGLGLKNNYIHTNI